MEPSQHLQKNKAKVSETQFLRKCKVILSESETFHHWIEHVITPYLRFSCTSPAASSRLHLLLGFCLSLWNQWVWFHYLCRLPPHVLPLRCSIFLPWRISIPTSLSWEPIRADHLSGYRFLTGCLSLPSYLSRSFLWDVSSRIFRFCISIQLIFCRLQLQWNLRGRGWSSSTSASSSSSASSSASSSPPSSSSFSFTPWRWFLDLFVFFSLIVQIFRIFLPLSCCGAGH